MEVFLFLKSYFKVYLQFFYIYFVYPVSVSFDYFFSSTSLSNTRLI